MRDESEKRVPVRYLKRAFPPIDAKGVYGPHEGKIGLYYGIMSKLFNFQNWRPKRQQNLLKQEIERLKRCKL